MVAAAGQLSLVDDWRQRRHRLTGPSETNRSARFQIRLLDYLIRRYGNSPVANGPARFPLRGEHRTDRAIVVRQELSRRTAKVRDQRDAKDRVLTIVRRMSDPASEQRSAPVDELAVEQVARAEARRPIDRETALWCQSQCKVIAHELAGGDDPRQAITEYLQVWPYLPANVLQFLSDRAGEVTANDWVSARLLGCCRSGGVVDHIVWAWRRRVAARRIDETTNELRRFLIRADVREEAAERMRAMLADDDGLVRLEASAFLGRIGMLDDIGLLSDLLALPPMTDEDPRERKGLLLAMRRISHREVVVACSYVAGRSWTS
jgi:hypothetical protein